MNERATSIHCEKDIFEFYLNFVFKERNVLRRKR